MEILCERIRRIFQEDQIDVQEVEDVFRAYKSNPDDWSKFAQFNDNTYTRNLVDVGNGKYNLMILCWGPGMGSSIHSHTDAHCFVKMLDGALLEQRFEWPSSNDHEQPLKQISSNVCSKNDVTYICDELGLHRMENPSHVDNAVSLHLYIPPFQECHSFDQKTGRMSTCRMKFDTKYGKLITLNDETTCAVSERKPSDCCQISMTMNSSKSKPTVNAVLNNNNPNSTPQHVKI